MKYLLVSLFLLFSCSHEPLKHYKKTYPEVRTDILYQTEFGFVIDNNKYNFGRVTTQDGDMACDYFLGYKNDHLTYQFSTFHEESLINLFKDKKPFNKKTRAILSKIEEINSMNKAESERNKNNCRSMSQTRKDSIGYGIVFSPFIVLIMPVIIPQYIFEQIKENDIFKKVKGISLNQSLAETEKTLGAPRRMNTKEGYKILSYSWSAQAPVYANYFFENDQLVGFISGFDSRPQTVIEQTK